MIDINKEFDTSRMTDVHYCALQTFVEAGLDLGYLESFNKRLKQYGKHWLTHLLYCYEMMDENNFSVLCKKLDYDEKLLSKAFRIIKRSSDID